MSSNPAFSSFRELMDRWDKNARLFEENDLCMFFKKDGIVYGATETGRIAYARMKSPESEDDRVWVKDASVVLYNLEKPIDDNKVVMGVGDLLDLKPITKDKAEKILKNKGKELPSVNDDDDDDDAYYGEE
jgi:hypothetical protein